MEGKDENGNDVNEFANNGDQLMSDGEGAPYSDFEFEEEEMVVEEHAER